MKIVKLSAAQFDRFAANHKYRNYFQTSMYANVMSKFGYHAQFLGIVSDDNKLSGATVILYKTVFMKNKIAYAPRGILFNYENRNQLEELVHKLKSVLGKQGFMVLRIDPYIPLSIRDTDGAIMNFNAKGNEIIENLKSVGFEYKGKNIYFETEKPRWEAIVTLQRDLEELFSRLDKRTRNKIRKALNSGVVVERDSTKNINKLFSFVGKKDNNPLSFYKEMKEQFDVDIDIYYAKIKAGNYVVNSRRNYEKEIEYNESLSEKIQDLNIDPKEKELYINKKIESDKLINSFKANLLKATDILKQNPDGIFIGGAMVIRYDNAAYIYTEGFDEQYSSLNPSALLKWQMISDYTQEGFKYINLNAVVGEFEKQNKYSGLNESKLGFNSIVTEYIGEFDIVLNGFAFNWYKKLNKGK